MSNENGGNSTNDSSIGGAFLDLGRALRDAAADPANQKAAKDAVAGAINSAKDTLRDPKLRQNTKNFLTGAINDAVGIVKPKTPEEIETERKEKLRQKQIQDDASEKELGDKQKKEESDRNRQAGSTSNPSGGGPDNPESSEGNKGAKDEPEDIGMIAQVMLAVLPQGAKDWAAAAAVPMITQGKNILASLPKNKKVHVSDSPMAYVQCLSDPSVVPKSVHDYAKVILNNMPPGGLGDNEEMVNDLCVGFIAWVRENLSPLSMGLVKPLKGFNASATGSIKDMLHFGKDPAMLARLFSFAPADSAVDPELLETVKGVFGSEGVANIETYFPGNQMSYGQFVAGYAQMGHDMMAKWGIDPAKIPDSVKEAARATLEKSGATPDDDAINGLAAACQRGAKFIQQNLDVKPGQTAPTGLNAAPELDHH